MSRYEQYTSGKIKITMGGIENDMFAYPRDYEAFLKATGKLRKDPTDFGDLIQLTKKLIKQGTPKAETEEKDFDEQVERYLWKNIKELVDELTIAFGLATREELDKAKKDFEAREAKK